MKSYIIILTILFMIISPLIVIASLITYYINLSDGIILLAILVFTMIFSLFLVTLKMGYDKNYYHSRRYHHNLRASLEEEEDNDALTSERDSSTGDDFSNDPPLYNDLYPKKLSIPPFNPHHTVPSVHQSEATFYINPLNGNGGNPIPHTLRNGPDVHVTIAEVLEEDELPSYAEAMMLSKQV